MSVLELWSIQACYIKRFHSHVTTSLDKCRLLQQKFLLPTRLSPLGTPRARALPQLPYANLVFLGLCSNSIAGFHYTTRSKALTSPFSAQSPRIINHPRPTIGQEVPVHSVETP